MHPAGSQRRSRYVGRYQGLLGDVVLAATGIMIVLLLGVRAAHPAGALLTVLCAVLMVLRRRHPVALLLASTGMGAVAISLGRPPDGLFAVAGLITYSAALYSSRRRPWLYGFLMWGTLMTAGSVVHGADWWVAAQLGPFAFMLGGAAVGDAIRMRQAYIGEVTERARQAELTREEEARRRVMDERLRIARELHDVVAHHITVISVHAGAADHVLRNDPEKVWPVLGQIRSAADAVLEEIKAVVSVLRDPDEVRSTEPAPGVERLPELLAGLRSTDFAVRHRQHGQARPLPAVVDLAAYRIVQEALTNAHRYGDGLATLDLEYTADTVGIEVTNRVAVHRPGNRAPGSGFGLLGMRERAAAARGTIVAGPVDGGLFRVRAELPTDDRAISRLNPPDRASLLTLPPMPSPTASEDA